MPAPTRYLPAGEEPPPREDDIRATLRRLEPHFEDAALRRFGHEQTARA